MPDPFVPAGPMRVNPIYDGRPTADPFSGPRPNGRVTLDSSADMFAFVNQGASAAPDRGPYSLTPAQMTRGGKTEKIVLVGINGTHLPWADQAHQSTGFMTDLRAGLGFENAYVRSVKADLMALPPGTKLVIAGHSLGGIVAQELAADPDIRARHEVLNTVSFGSPALKPNCQEGAVHRLVDAHDPIPLLSWDGIKSEVGARAEGAQQGGQAALDRSLSIAREGGLPAIFSRRMIESILQTPDDVVSGALGATKNAVTATMTTRDANMRQSSTDVPGPAGYLSMSAHTQSYADPKTWGGITALGEGYSKATRATITFKESDVGWRMTEPVLTEKGWNLPLLKWLRPILSNVAPSQTDPDGPLNAQSGTRFAGGAPGDAAVEGEKVRAAMAMVLRTDAGLPEATTLAGTRPEQLAAVREVMAGRGAAVTPEQAAAVLDLAETLGPEHLMAASPRHAAAGGLGVEAGPTRLAQSERPAPETGPSV